jgi:predicted anti-sigma-YlaC factor YlaD
MEHSVLVCRDMTELATDYLENALPFARRLGVRVHLAYCSMCRRYYRQVRETVALLRRLPAEPVPRATEDAVIARSHDDPPDLPPPLRPPRG